MQSPGEGGGGLDYLSAHNFNWSWLPIGHTTLLRCLINVTDHWIGGTLKLSNLIRPSLDFKIYFYFIKSLSRVLFLKYST